MPFLKLIAYLSIMPNNTTNHKQGFPLPIIFFSIKSVLEQE